MTIVADLVGKVPVQHVSASKSQSRHGGPGGGKCRWVAGDSDGRKKWEIADERGRAAVIASTTWSPTMPRTFSSLFPGVTVDEEMGGGQQVSVGAARDDGPGDPEEGSITSNGDKNESMRQLRH